ncbi:UNVERIFIED_CONTAM: hypothetical protein HDU68_007917 [Siphonaria sp. JEL0065]|nr:hypothetical protein HDU68_007917 [Siphonaria sp. JEL0065]
MGTYPLLHIILLLCASTSAIYVGLTFIAGFLFKGLWTGCVAGLSGIVFALISLEANKGDLQTQDFFGLKIPGSMFPWFLLIVTQFLFMSSSFFGHLSGILAGVAYAQGFLDRFFPGPSYFHRLESTPFFSILHGFPTYVPQPGGVSLPTYASSTPMPNLSNPTTGGNVPAAGLAGLTGPLWALKLTYMVDNPWGSGLTKVKKLEGRVKGNRPVTLIGFSLGVRVTVFLNLHLVMRPCSRYLEYRSTMPRILKHVGFSVDDEFFDDDGEKEADLGCC